MESRTIVSWLLVTVVLFLSGFSIIYMSRGIGDENTRNELQKQISILAITNSIMIIFLGFLLYQYIGTQPQNTLPFMIIVSTFNMFLGIMAISIAVLQKLS